MKTLARIALCVAALFCSPAAQAETIVAENYYFFDDPTSKKSDDAMPVWMKYPDAGKRQYVIAFGRHPKTTGGREIWCLVADPEAPGKEFASMIAGRRGGVSMQSLGGDHRPVRAEYPAWSPDGSARLVYVQQGLALRLGRVDLTAGFVEGREWVRLGGNILRPDWSARGLVVFVSDLTGMGDLYVAQAPVELPPASVGQSDLTRVTHNDFLDTEPAWSPDGTRLAYVAEQGGSSSVFVIDDIERVLSEGPVRTGRRLTSLKANLANPTWSADGRRVAFYALGGTDDTSDDLFALDEGAAASTTRLFVVNASGTGLKKLAEDVLPRRDRGPAWLAQPGMENKIVYISRAEPEPALYVVDAETGQQQRVELKVRQISDVACIPSGGDALIALSAYGPEGAKRIYIKRLYFSNDR